MEMAAKPSNSITEYPIMIERKKFKVILNISIKDLADCKRLIGTKHDEMQLLFRCEPMPSHSISLEIDRISGGLVYSIKATRPDKEKIHEYLYFGVCQKTKPKF